MLDCYDDDAVPNLVERRFFAALAAVRTLEGECEVLREVMELAAEAWRGARTRLVDLETLSDELGMQLTEANRKLSQMGTSSRGRLALSAA
jgi:hypothetical protein